MIENQILIGNVLDKLKELPDESVQCCVTSPPYYGLRNYGTEGILWDANNDCSHEWETAPPRRERHEKDVVNKESRQSNNTGANCNLPTTDFCKKCGAWKGELGLEPTPELFVKHLTAVFREVKRILRKDGVLWLNLGDSYHGSWGNYGNRPELDGITQEQREKNVEYINRRGWDEKRERPFSSFRHEFLKPKDLIGIPWRTAFALQQDGWWLRQDIIWAKPGVMPESVLDRCTKSHEYIFLLTKSKDYFYDNEAIKEDCVNEESLTGIRPRNAGTMAQYDKENYKKSGSIQEDGTLRSGMVYTKRNKRDVWTISVNPFRGAHFATFPEEIPEICIKAGTKEDDIVLDPFFGSGTTGLVAKKLGRKYIGIEINPEYARIAQLRVAGMTDWQTAQDIKDGKQKTLQ